ncbi:CG30098 [Drosophila busckii]|uniref:CLIP domain-containing serine protease n=1 Tax=Drosophila busckii TaxID=30019 RepID=A0A0M4F4R2_DROBS|nr:phenoloxidase-activating factor 3 [Drosophila busckii]ALC46395.1 CG30098 [Drosophila busckii]
MQLLIIGSLALMLLAPELVLTQSDNSCHTPIDELGYCVPALQCQFVLDLQATYGSNVPRAIQTQLRQMACNAAGSQNVFHLCCPTRAVISAQSGGNSGGPSTARTKAPVTVRQATMDLKRIDPSGMALLNSVTDCGKKSNIKLSGGEVTRIGEFPWLALLKYETTGRPFLCGGSLISDQFVLTAAHCVASGKIIGVRLGEHNLDTEEDCQYLGGRRRECLPPYEEYGISEIRQHPSYKENTINYDIALLKLDRPVKFKQHIKPVCLPIDANSKDIAYDQSFFTAGWGRTEKDVASSVLLKAVVKRQDLNVCRNYFIDAPVTENHICAVGEGILHTCRGDSGGPVFFRNAFKETIRYVQYGIVSFGGRRCGTNRNQPSVFSNVIDMLPWITQNLY